MFNHAFSLTPRCANLTALASLVLLVIVVNVDTMPASLYPGDPYWMMHAGRSLLLRGSLDIKPMSGIAEGQYYVRNPRNNLYYSKYGTMNSLLFTPPLFLAWKLDGSLTRIRTRHVLLSTNLYYVFLSVLLAVYLYVLAGLYVRAPMVKLFYVLSSFYATFLWNYLRAQTSELFQVLLFTAFVVHFVRAQRSPNRFVEFALAWILLAALCLTKLSFLILVPMAWLATSLGLGVAAERWQPAGRTHIPILIATSAAVAIACTVGLVNWTKFGSVWLTGYHAWQPDRHLPSSAEGIVGFLCDRQWSLFLNYPPLLLALLGLKPMLRRFPREAAFLGGVFALNLLLIGSIPTWKGEWGYGPRYLLFLLPAVSLPFALVLERACSAPSSPGKAALMALCVGTLGTSLWFQVQVNRLPFLVYYRLLPAAVLGEHRSLDLADSELSFFASKPVQVICAEIVKNRDNPEELECFREFRAHHSTPECQRYLAALTFLPALDNYWFP